MHRACLLDEDYQPRASFVEWRGNAILTDKDLEAVIWKSSR